MTGDELHNMYLPTEFLPRSPNKREQEDKCKEKTCGEGQAKDTVVIAKAWSQQEWW